MNLKGFEFNGAKVYEWGEMQELINSLSQDSFKFTDLERDDDGILCSIRVLNKDKAEDYLKNDLSLKIDGGLIRGIYYLFDNEDFYKLVSIALKKAFDIDVEVVNCVTTYKSVLVLFELKK